MRANPMNKERDPDDTLMKAVACPRYGPPEVLELIDMPKPRPRPGELLIRVYATAVTTSDVRVRAFRFPLNRPIGLLIRAAIGITKPRNPILGINFAGVVESAGSKVTRFKPGDEVHGMTGFRMGMYAEYVCVSEKAAIAIKPSSLDFEEAAGIVYGALIAGDCLNRAGIQSRKRVLVYGASGANGTAAVQLAKHYGASVTAVCSSRNFELARSLGADRTLDYTNEDTLPDDERYDLVFDAVGVDKTSALKEACRKALTPGGVYTSVDDGTPVSRAENLVLVNRLAEEGAYQTVIDRRFAFEDMVEAHRYVDSGRKRGNVVATVVSTDSPP